MMQTDDPKQGDRGRWADTLARLASTAEQAGANADAEREALAVVATIRERLDDLPAEGLREIRDIVVPAVDQRVAAATVAPPDLGVKPWGETSAPMRDALPLQLEMRAATLELTAASLRTSAMLARLLNDVEWRLGETK
jgi:hypothetical protein